LRKRRKLASVSFLKQRPILTGGAFTAPFELYFKRFNLFRALGRYRISRASFGFAGAKPHLAFAGSLTSS